MVLIIYEFAFFYYLYLSRTHTYFHNSITVSFKFVELKKTSLQIENSAVCFDKSFDHIVQILDRYYLLASWHFDKSYIMAFYTNWGVGIIHTVISLIYQKKNSDCSSPCAQFHKQLLYKATPPFTLKFENLSFSLFWPKKV